MAGWAHRCGHPVAFMAIESCMRNFVEQYKKKCAGRLSGTLQ